MLVLVRYRYWIGSAPSLVYFDNVNKILCRVSSSVSCFVLILVWLTVLYETSAYILFVSHRTNTLLEKVAAAVEQSAFYSALWGSILTSPAVRLAGVSFVLLHLNRKLSMEDQLFVMGSDIELMVRDLMCLKIRQLKILHHRIPCPSIR